MAIIGKDINKAVDFLKAGQLVGMPTETVYGLAGNALDESAILKIFKTKNRPQFDPLIVHVANLGATEGIIAEIPEKAQLLADQFWPGPLTMLFNKTETISDLLTSGLQRVAIRVPRHPMALALLKSLDFPLAAPSANPFGYVSPTSAQHVEDQLGKQIPYILDGGLCKVGLESTILGFENNEVIVHRLGGKTIEEIEEVVGDVHVQINSSSNPAAPGMLKSHYSPGKKLILGDIDLNLEEYASSRLGIISFSKTYRKDNPNDVILSMNGDLEEAAANIFKALRKMDNAGIDVILAEPMPNIGLGRAINDRLNRAGV